jgi:hypothetical protein
MANVKRPKRSTPSFDVPEPVKSAAPPGWVYRSDEPPRVPPSRSIVAPDPIEPAVATSAVVDHERSSASGPPLAACESRAPLLFNPVPWLLVGYRMTARSIMTPFLVGATLMSGLNRR